MKKFVSHRDAVQSALSDPFVHRLRKLAGAGELWEQARPASRPRELSARSELVSRGQGLAAVSALHAGWAGHIDLLSDGRRQIVHLVLPGEVIAYPRRGCSLAVTTVSALTPVLVGTWRISEQPELASAQFAALAASDAIEHCCMANQITRIGRRSAYERVAHLFLEIRERLELAGISAGDRFPMPLTQETIADVLGITTVHVNRTLQQLRSERHVEIRGGMLELGNREQLMKIADYVPLMLNHALR